MGTVGLTLGITPELHIISRLILDRSLCIWGRVGGMTLIYAVFSRKNNNGAKMPLEKITVGKRSKKMKNIFTYWTWTFWQTYCQAAESDGT